MSAPTLTQPTTARPQATQPLSVRRLNAMRGGYLLMAVGLVVVKWPLLPSAHTMPLFTGVTVCLLTAMSVLAFLGVRYPSKFVPVLLFETAWKVLWLGLIALPKALDGTMDAATSEIVVNCSFVVPIIAVTPWRYAWRTYVTATGDRWR